MEDPFIIQDLQTTQYSLLNILIYKLVATSEKKKEKKSKEGGIQGKVLVKKSENKNGRNCDVQQDLKDQDRIHNVEVITKKKKNHQ